MSEMRISRSQQKKDKTVEQEPLNIQLDLATLNVLCKFVLSDSTYVRRYDLAQLRRFIRLIDKSMMHTYSEEVKDRLIFIRLALSAKLDQRLTNKDAIIGYISSKFPKDIDFIDPNVDMIGREDINWVNNIVSETLKYAFIYKDIPELRDLCNEFSQTTIGHRGDVVDKFENCINKMKNQFREVKVQDESNTFFSLQGDTFENQITDTYNAVRSPSRRLMTGMVGLNLLTGGFENGRVYMLIGDSGVGKSITLLNILLQLKKHNRNYKTKDPTKTPCVVMLTMENTLVETITRLFSLVNMTDRPMSKYTDLNEVMKILREQGGLVVNDDSPIDIVIKYKPNHSVSTDYLYDLYDELGDNGYEPICLIQDHVKRIRSTEIGKEFRIELGDIVNEFKVFAADKDIPVITDSHINRQGSSTIERGLNKGRADITRLIGKSDIGESIMMIENLDMAIVINKEWDAATKTLYMVFSSIKMRDNAQLSYIAQPFADSNNPIRLVEDINLPTPVFKRTLREQGDIYAQAATPANVVISPWNNFEDDIPKDIESAKQDIGVSDISKNIEALTVHDNPISKEDDPFGYAKQHGLVCPLQMDNDNEDIGLEDQLSELFG